LAPRYRVIIPTPKLKAEAVNEWVTIDGSLFYLELDSPFEIHTGTYTLYGQSGQSITYNIETDEFGVE
jgi:hypothetical protein